MAENLDLTGDTIASTYVQLLHIGKSEGIESAGTGHFVADGNGTESILSLDAGRVGIGTESPQGTLHVSAATAQIRVTDSDSGETANDGLYIQQNANVSYFINREADKMHLGTSDAEKLTIDADGKVGIGTDSPGTLLEVRGGTGTGFGGAGILTLSTAELSVVDGTDDVLGVILFQAPIEDDGSPDGRLPSAGIWATAEQAFHASDNSTALHFATAASETAKQTGNIRMTIDSTGNVGIGTTTPDSQLNIQSVEAGGKRLIKCADSSGSKDTDDILVDLDYSGDDDIDDAFFIIFQDSDGVMGSISGNANTTTFDTTSDYRLKTDYKYIVDATGTINQLKLYDFAWKKNENKRAMGVIAHEAQAIVPSAIIGKKDAMTTKDYKDENGEVKTKDVIATQQADYSKFVPLLLKSIQELSAKVTALENA